MILEKGRGRPPRSPSRARFPVRRGVDDRHRGCAFITRRYRGVHGNRSSRLQTPVETPTPGLGVRLRARRAPQKQEDNPVRWWGHTRVHQDLPLAGMEDNPVRWWGHTRGSPGCSSTVAEDNPVRWWDRTRVSWAKRGTKQEDNPVRWWGRTSTTTSSPRYTREDNPVR